MNYIKSQQADGSVVNLFYQDIGAGRPVVFIHGWPLNSQMWQYQFAELPKYDIRCIAYDRRGFGKSDKPFDGYDYDTLADDLKAILDGLDLDDVVLVGFSMGGGEVVRYFSKHGGARVSKVVLIGSVTPFLLQTDDNPEGVSQDQLDQMVEEIYRDHAGFIHNFSKQFYNVSLMSHPASQGILDWWFHMAIEASIKAMADCVYSFGETDFRDEMAAVNVPTLIIHGDEDNIVPLEASAEEAADFIADSQLLIYEDEPHGLFFTAKDQLNTDLIEFITGTYLVDEDDEEENEDDETGRYEME